MVMIFVGERILQEGTRFCEARKVSFYCSAKTSFLRVNWAVNCKLYCSGFKEPASYLKVRGYISAHCQVYWKVASADLKPRGSTRGEGGVTERQGRADRSLLPDVGHDRADGGGVNKAWAPKHAAGQRDINLSYNASELPINSVARPL